MELSEEILATHADLSPVAEQFLHYASTRPTLAERPRWEEADLPEWLLTAARVTQPWPTFVSDEKLHELKHAALEINALVKSIPFRIFDGDPQKIWDYYRITDPALIALLLEPPTGLEEALIRCDLIDSPSGFKFLEVNTGAVLGGWQASIWEPLYLSDPEIALFLAENSIRPRHHNPLYTLFAHIIKESHRRLTIDQGELNIVFVVSHETYVHAELVEYISNIYREVLEEIDPDLGGKLIIHFLADGGLAARDGKIYLNDQRIHALLEYTDETPEIVFRTFKANTVSLFNSPLSKLLGSKKTLALLSEHADSDRFTESERSAIRKYIPWSRRVVDGPITYRDECLPMSDLLLKHQRRFVLKPHIGHGGEGIHLGRSTTPEDWRRAVHHALQGNGTMVAQEFVESRPYLFQGGDLGPIVHNVIWGAFCFGDAWGGGTLRMAPRLPGAGVINVTQGATRSLLFEV